MTTTLPRPSWPLITFLVLSAIVYATAVLLVVPILSVTPHPKVLATALMADMIVLVPLAYVLLMVRVRGLKARTILPIVATCVAAAWWILPAAHRGLLNLLVIALPALEIGGLALVLFTLVRLLRRTPHADPFEQIQTATVSTLGDHIGSRALAYELSVIRYALGRSVTPAPSAFPIRRGYGALLAGVLIAVFLELVGGHLLISHFWGETAALIHLAVSVYALLWILGDWRALGSRSIRLHDGVLHVQIGIRWTLDIPVQDIETIYHVRGPLPNDAPILDVSVLKTPQFILELRAPVRATGPYGIQRDVQRLALSVDEPDRFLDALAEDMGPS